MVLRSDGLSAHLVGDMKVSTAPLKLLPFLEGGKRQACKKSFGS